MPQASDCPDPKPSHLWSIPRKKKKQTGKQSSQKVESRALSSNGYAPASSLAMKQFSSRRLMPSNLWRPDASKPGKADPIPPERCNAVKSVPRRFWEIGEPRGQTPIQAPQGAHGGENHVLPFCHSCGHIMTMLAPNMILTLPNPNDPT